MWCNSIHQDLDVEWSLIIEIILSHQDWVIETWGNMWLWENPIIRGEMLWLGKSIADNSFVVLMDGSFMKDTYPQINLAASIFECTKGRRHLWGSFVENTRDAGSYWGELLGLMAIHLIL
jgi:hypothetical protein